jgi:hypothetical protein
MKHVPGHHGRGMEAGGPIVAPGAGHQEIVARPSLDPLAARSFTRRVQENTFILSTERAWEIEDGVVCHDTPAMKKNKEECGET